MPAKKMLFGSVVMSLLYGSAAFSAPPPQGLVVLGDSLTDSGNSRAVTGFFDLPPATFPYPRFCPITDGTTWPVLLSEALGDRLTPFTRGGQNYAYVAALTVDMPSFFGPVNPSLADQVTLIPPTASRNDPAFVFGGANDIYGVDSIFNPNPGFDAAVNLAEILTSLHDLGFKYLFILNMPDIGATPSVLGTAAASIYSFQAAELNRELLIQLHSIGFPVFEVNTAQLFENVLANFQSYGFSSVTTSPSPNPYPIPGGQGTAGFAFWYDGTHFTEAVHQLIADYIYASISGAETFATLAETPFAVLRQQSFAVRQELYPNQPLREPCEYYFFANGTYAPMSLPAVSGSCTSNSMHGGNIAVGVLRQMTEAWNLGIAGEVSLNEYHRHSETTHSEYDLNAFTLSLFGGWTAVPCISEETPARHQGGYVNFIANVAFLDFDDVKRTFSVGPVSQQAKGCTDGMDYYGFIYGAYYIPTCSEEVSTGPIADLEYQYATVDGYHEHGASYGNLVFNGEHNSSFATGLGWELRYENPCWIADAFLSINRQWLGSTRKIHFHEKSLPGTNGLWPAKMPKTTFVSGGIDFSISCGHGIQVDVGYTFNAGISKIPMREQFISLNISI